MIDDELLELQSQWRQDDAGVEQIRERAQRDDRRHRTLAVLEYLCAGMLLGGSLALALWRDQSDVWTWAAAIWLLGVPALLFAWWNRRGLWGNSGLDAQAHLRLSLRRCQRSLRALRIGYGALVASTVVVTLFAVGVLGSHHGVHTTMLMWLTAVVAIHLVVMGWLHRRLLRRRNVLLSLVRELDLPDV